MDSNGLRFWQLADRAAWPDLRHAGVANSSSLGGQPFSG